MTAPRRSRLDVRLYRACLGACPPAFHREYAEEMLRDFVEARDEASRAGPRALWLLRLGFALDLLRTAATQWGQTGWPVIALVSVMVPLLLAEGLAALARRAAFVVSPHPAGAETFGVVLLATVLVVLIATTIALTLAAAPALRPRRR